MTVFSAGDPPVTTKVSPRSIPQEYLIIVDNNDNIVVALTFNYSVS